MNRNFAVLEWREYVKPIIVARCGENDVPALRESWNDFTDSMAKNGRITWQQCDNWTPPKECA